MKILKYVGMFLLSVVICQWCYWGYVIWYELSREKIIFTHPAIEVIGDPDDYDILPGVGFEPDAGYYVIRNNRFEVSENKRIKGESFWRKPGEPDPALYEVTHVTGQFNPEKQQWFKIKAINPENESVFSRGAGNVWITPCHNLSAAFVERFRFIQPNNGVEYCIVNLVLEENRPSMGFDELPKTLSEHLFDHEQVSEAVFLGVEKPILIKEGENYTIYDVLFSKQLPLKVDKFAPIQKCCDELGNPKDELLRLPRTFEDGALIARGYEKNLSVTVWFIYEWKNNNLTKKYEMETHTSWGGALFWLDKCRMTARRINKFSASEIVVVNFCNRPPSKFSLLVKNKDEE